MEFYLRIGLLGLAVIVVLLLIFESWYKKKLLNSTDDLAVMSVDEFFDPELLIISVIAKPGENFGSYDLLQSISATGLQYGEMNIFHYYLEVANGKIKLFSLASATEPGDFDLDNMGSFTCTGLTLFFDLHRVPRALHRKAFGLMLSKAEQLADDLNGELRAGPDIAWSSEMIQQYEDKVTQFSRPVIESRV